MVDVAHAAPGQELLDAILSRSTGRHSPVHGPTHWAGVAAAGLSLLDRTGADPLVVLLFSLYHDAMRESDGHDPEHGARGAQRAREMRDAGELDLDDERLEVLVEACTYHDKGQTSADPNIGVCWDSDRLNLRRVRIEPAAEYMSTEAGRAYVGSRGLFYFTFFKFDWPAIFLEYAVRAGVQGPGEAVYLRFGDLPEDGRSQYAWHTRKEEGVSVYHGYRTGDSYQIDARRLMLGTETMFARHCLHQGRPLYVVSGEPVGMGGNGEPLLANARIVREVSPEEDIEILPHQTEIEECIQWWRAKRASEAGEPGEFPYPLLVRLPCDRSIEAADTLADYGGSFASNPLKRIVEEGMREQLKRWGILEAYESLPRKPRRALPPRPAPESWQNTSWQATPWR